MWPPKDLDEYAVNVTTHLSSTTLSQQLDERCQQIEEALSTTLANMTNPLPQHHNNDQDTPLNHLIQQRRASANNKSERIRISKQIKKEMRAIKRAQQQAQIESILAQYKDLKRISGIKSSKQKDLIAAMTTGDGHEEHNRKCIANIFADFYAAL